MQPGGHKGTAQRVRTGWAHWLHSGSGTLVGHNGAINNQTDEGIELNGRLECGGLLSKFRLCCLFPPCRVLHRICDWAELRTTGVKA